MNIWAPLPNNTNTLYVVKVAGGVSGNPVTWSPDPGTRVKIYMGSFTVTTPPIGVVRQPQWRLLYGSDVVGVGTAAVSLGANTTYRITMGKFYRWSWGVTDRAIQVYWDSDIYLTSDFTLEIGGTVIEGLDMYADLVLYLDCWNDMTMRVSG